GSFRELRITHRFSSSKLKKLSEIPARKALNKKQHCRLTHKNPYSIIEERNCFFSSFSLLQMNGFPFKERICREVVAMMRRSSLVLDLFIHRRR
ncbi:unnamed protein product, partial [Hymenolepis diminuta]